MAFSMSLGLDCLTRVCMLHLKISTLAYGYYIGQYSFKLVWVCILALLPIEKASQAVAFSPSTKRRQKQVFEDSQNYTEELCLEKPNK